MELLTGMAGAANVAVLALAGLGGLDLARRGGFRPAELGMGLVALGQLTTPAEPGPGWGWLIRSGAALVVIYVLWQTGRMVAGLEAGSERRETRGEGEASPGFAEATPGKSPDPLSLRERGKEATRVRAVASWPGRRR